MYAIVCVCVHVSVYECSVPPPWISSSFHAEKGWKMLTLCQIVTQSLASLPELLPVALQTGCDGNAGANRLCLTGQSEIYKQYINSIWK